MTLELRHLRAFAAVAEELSFSRAADLVAGKLALIDNRLSTLPSDVAPRQPMQELSRGGPRTVCTGSSKVSARAI
jgi:hypothetical protein